MSWSISVSGTRQQCIDAVKAQVPGEYDTPESKEQFEAHKALLLTELEKSSDAAGPQVKTFSVSLYGHADASGSRNYGGGFSFSWI